MKELFAAAGPRLGVAASLAKLCLPDCLLQALQQPAAVTSYLKFHTHHLGLHPC